MKIFIATDIIIRVCGDKIYARNKYSTIIKRYYKAFGMIVLYSRIENIDSVIDDCDDITDMIDSIIPISSLMNVLVNRDNAKILKAMRGCNLVICRCPSISAYKAADCAKKLGIPYFAESMGCAWDAYWNHGISGKIIAPYMFFKMKSVVKNADYALYVTSEFLQQRYPRKKTSISASNVLINNIDNEVLKKRIKKIENMDASSITLMTTAAVNVKYKGQQYVIKSIPQINKAGVRVKYYVVGEGSQTYLKSVADKYNVSDQVIFTGRLPLNEVFELLDDTDIYIQPSLQEGLPRSVIEAMSRGCIVVGAKTAGIPELLDPQYVFKRKSSSEIAEKIMSICKLGDNIKIKNSERNVTVAKQFVSGVLDKRRSEYYEMIKTEIGC